MNIAAIIQARMGSTRLPGKVLMDLGGETVLSRVVRRLGRAKLPTKIVIATTVSAADEAIVRECERLGVAWFCGSESDVLDRYYQAGKAHAAEVVVRITSDCPFIDPELVDETIRVCLAEKADYASNVSPRTYPRGLDTEVFTLAALEWAWREAREPHQREHVTPYIIQHRELFGLASTFGEHDYSRYRWTVDTAEDLQLAREIYTRFAPRDDFGWREIITVMEREPALAELNAHIVQKPVHGN
jgi:spore coat polysaccharide biosynthesis protein SpsF (cytidylyltransferase family)